MRHALKLLAVCLGAIGCGGAPFSTIDEIRPLPEAGAEASHEAGSDAGGDAGDASSSAPDGPLAVDGGQPDSGADGGEGKDAAVGLDAQAPEAEASFDAGFDTSAEAAVETGPTCTPIAPHAGSAQWGPGYPCGSLPLQQLPGYFAWQGPAFSCGWQATPSACAACAEDYVCDCLKKLSVCTANGQTWQGCTEGVEGGAPTVECR